MARMEFDDLGMRVTGGDKSSITVDASELVAATRALGAALESLLAAWAAMPVGLRRGIGPVTIDLHRDGTASHDIELREPPCPT